MLAQFRARYPTGGLVSELLVIRDGQFIVRVLVQSGGVTLASGLATAETLEEAEDRARERALQALGMGAVADFPKADLPKFETTSAPPEGHREEWSPPPPALAEESTPRAETEPAEPPPMPSDDWLSATYLKKPQPSEAAGGGRKTSLPPLPGHENEVETAPERYSESYPMPEEFSPPPPTPKPPKKTSLGAIESPDLSSDIAKTDIHLKRLGWTTKQGREYLLNTYGKVSRSHLSEEELLDFLHYLESLDTPPQGGSRESGSRN
ncbi:hypothetical protein [Lyngbya sp. CCY1209]|uniref:hypothetical protein n=1 Tax=Lyngbya sp. CCY1209 TaxID=2886103 RepID=UPI002D205257|nr:hypothetical protein [Lyngbya sp. CCY1209]MEB3883706.1 hypothetical protein [Lyngbya sp. CCY1209]